MGTPLPRWAEVLPMLRGLFVITDPGKDQDDEDVLVQLNRYIRLGILETLGVVANLAPSMKRARLAKGTLQALGQGEIPVGWGTDCLQKDDDGLNYQFEVGYLAHEESVLKGTALIFDTLLRAPEKGVILSLISGLTDAANAMRTNPDLFCRKVRRVVIMGGVETTPDGLNVRLDQDGCLIPDSSQNHTFDMDSTQFLYKALQMNGIPITVVSRHAAGAAKVPRSMYDAMGQTGHPIGVRVHHASRKAIQHLWERTWLPASDPRRKLPPRCNPQWFREEFFDGAGEQFTAETQIWDHVKAFMLYDPLTLIATIPTLRGYFYEPFVIENRGAENHIIGLSKERHSVARPEELKTYLETSLVESLMMSMEERRTG